MLPKLPPEQVGKPSVAQAQQGCPAKYSLPALPASTGFIDGCGGIGLGEFVKQSGGVAEMRCGTSQGPASRRETGFDSGQDAMAQVVAGETQIGVAGVIDPAEFFFLCIGKDFLSANFQQRAQAPGSSCGICRRFNSRHCPRTLDACTTQQAKKDSFGLVIAMMPKDEPIAGHLRQRGMASNACGFFQPAWMTTRYIDPEYVQGYAALVAETSTEILPPISRLVKPMMDVHGLQHISKTLLQDVEHVQQYDRVDSPRERTTQAMTGTNARSNQRCGSGIKHRCGGTHGFRQQPP